MARFLAASSIAGAVERLGTSRAKSTVTDYLVFRRAFVLTDDGTDEVATGERSEPFVQALTDLSRAIPEGGESEWDRYIWFSPFGAAQVSGRGYKKRYDSNGPATAVNSWASRPNCPLEHVPETAHPKRYRLKPQSADGYARFFLKNDGDKPRLVDAAVWFYRFTDVDGLLTGSDPMDDLIAAFKTAVGLSREEIEGLFDTGHADLPALAFEDERADPRDYMPAAPATGAREQPSGARPARDVSDIVGRVIDYVTASGYTFEPWQIAAFLTAIRTKPFVILAGISGTGKTRLPRLVAEATESVLHRIPVKPDWTDSSELLGYRTLSDGFVPGSLLIAARAAADDPEHHHFVLLDEMNVARVEYYLAEVLSHIEDLDEEGSSAPLVPSASDEWKDVRLPANLSIVGSVNMDETTFGFSRKVLDRAFVIEFSDVDLATRPELGTVEAQAWSLEDWNRTEPPAAYTEIADNADVVGAVAALIEINDALKVAQLQVGYRIRDEIARFCRNAASASDSFTTSDGAPIDPLDLALNMKVLPRVHGGGGPVQEVLTRLREWATREEDADARSFPLFADRLDLMHSRLTSSGVASYWL